MAHGLRYYISLHITSSHCMADFPTILVPRLYRAFHSRLPLSLRVPTVLSYCSTGISTCCPSATPLGLALGPDLPRADEPSSGNLGFSVRGILTHVPLLTPAFSLPSAPAVLTVNLRRPWNAPLPLILTYESAISVLCLAPVHLRRSVTRLVSYYALFKGWLLLSQPPSCFDNSTSFPT